MVFFYTLHVVKIKASVFIGSIYSFYGGGVWLKLSFFAEVFGKNQHVNPFLLKFYCFMLLFVI
ncbi:hypothetical protein [Helicobacter bilis]|uniref:hypothetical protein n=1 Tax=Helicobacter bilis TaxID=37372 RepID=UPI0010FDA239|nr:hypothetical protein [Helicobacter bilis]TLE07658.1 hypothetical protein LS78_008315 [Helicobacter bilis]